MHRPRTSGDRIANALDCKLAGRQLITVLACSLLYMGWLFGISADPTAGEKPKSSDDGKPAAEKAADQPKKPDQAKPGQEKPIRGPSWPISRETTYFTEPLDKDGYVNYVAAGTLISVRVCNPTKMLMFGSFRPSGRDAVLRIGCPTSFSDNSVSSRCPTRVNISCPMGHLSAKK
jgi:hypothetical protein